jgi:trehalose synthase
MREHRRVGVLDTVTELIAPVIDAFSAKNQELDDGAIGAILQVAGLNDDGDVRGDPAFVRLDDTPGAVRRPAQLVEERPLRAEDPMVLQVSRWDRLKDPLGVIQGFVEYLVPTTDAHLVYAGPAVEAVSDDPEGAMVLHEAQDYLASVDRDARERVHLACLPMDDLEQNAAIVNALQRRADVVSAEEHRGGMWTHRRGGDVQGTSGCRFADRRHPGPDHRWAERDSAR